MSNPRLEVGSSGRIDVQDGSSLVFDNFSDIITPTQQSVLLYAGAKVKVAGKQYLGNASHCAVMELSNFDGSTQPVAGYFFNVKYKSAYY